VVSLRFAIRSASALLVAGFFAWLWSRGAIAPGSLGWLRVVPLFLLGFLAYEVIAYAAQSALDARSAETPSNARRTETAL
jgi:hypothetical protein